MQFDEEYKKGMWSPPKKIFRSVKFRFNVLNTKYFFL